MGVTEDVQHIVGRLRQGQFPNESSISTGVVLRMLARLGWDTFDPAVVWPEYQTGEGRADFALCHPPSRPAIFIEVKALGKAETGVRQALEYAFHTGVPFVVLTDGKTWSFYLPAEQGDYEDRRVHMLDLFERGAADAAEVFEKYLAFPQVAAGRHVEVARSEYRSKNRRARAKSAIPDAWREIVASGDEDLVRLVADAVEAKAGVRPEDDDVMGYLRSLIGVNPSARPVSRSPAPIAPAPPPAPASPPVAAARVAAVPPVSPEKLRSGELILSGRRHSFGSAREAMVLVLKSLAEADASFLSRLSQHPNMRGRKRVYLAQSAEELYPERPDLASFHAPIAQGWLVTTNINNVVKETILRAACDVAGLVFGSDLQVRLTPENVEV